jgi:hypothetical protein
MSMSACRLIVLLVGCSSAEERAQRQQEILKK